MPRVSEIEEDGGDALLKAVFDRQRAMFGGGIGEIAPDFTPAPGAVGILDAHEHGRPFGHGAEGGADRFLDWRTEDVGFDAGEGCPTHCLMFLPSPGFSPVMREV